MSIPDTQRLPHMPPEAEAGRRLHSRLADMLKAARAAGRPAFSACSPDEARALLASSCAALGRGPEVGLVRELSIPTRGGPIGARLFSPVERAEALIVYVHGGGWVLGTMDDYDALSRSLVARTNCALLLIDYRLAPEYPFPAGLEDGEDALDWALGHREELLEAGCCLIVAGDSAGANLATVAVNGERGRKVALQVLYYPVGDCDPTTPSYALPATELFLSREDMIWFFRQYAPPNLWADPRIPPLRAPDVSAMPPTWSASAEFDVLRDEAEAYARKLRDAGVRVWFRRFDGMGHGFIRMMNIVDDANHAFADLARLLPECCVSRNAKGRQQDD